MTRDVHFRASRCNWVLASEFFKKLAQRNLAKLKNLEKTLASFYETVALPLSYIGIQIKTLPHYRRELTGLRDVMQADAGIVPLAAGKYEFNDE